MNPLLFALSIAAMAPAEPAPERKQRTITLEEVRERKASLEAAVVELSEALDGGTLDDDDDKAATEAVEKANEELVYIERLLDGVRAEVERRAASNPLDGFPCPKDAAHGSTWSRYCPKCKARIRK